MSLKQPNIKEIVNDPEWQKLRSSMVGTWQGSAAKNVRTLRNYLGASPPLSPRFRRVHNYLTGSGFRIGVISHPDIDKFVTELRKKKNER